MAVNKIGVALIGAGSMACTHMRSMAQTDHLVLRLVCDINQTAAEHMAANYGEEGCRICSDYREAIVAADIDAVIIVTPNFLHHDILMDVIRAGKPYYLEKPIAMTLDEALEMKTKVRRRICPISLAFRIAFIPLPLPQRLGESRVLGDIRHIYSIYAHYPRPIPRHVRFENQGWYRCPRRLGAHTFDSLRLLAGEVECLGYGWNCCSGAS